MAKLNLHKFAKKCNSLDKQTMFNKIATTYDIINHIISFGQDIKWREKAIHLIQNKQGGLVLDIAAGSCDFTIAALALKPTRIISSDFASQMLTIGRKKINKKNIKHLIEFILCDALQLPFKDEVFDVTLVAFGIRNFKDRLKSLNEMYRVLKPDGITVILELTTPKAPWFALLFKFYVKKILPFIGKLISSHNYAYKYLPESVAEFPSEKDFVSLIKVSGFSEVQTVPLTFGVATIFLGRKIRN